MRNMNKPTRFLLPLLLAVLLLAACCPPAVSSTSYQLQDGQLHEAVQE